MQYIDLTILTILSLVKFCWIGPNGLTYLLAAASLAVGPQHLTKDIFGELPCGFCHLSWKDRKNMKEPMERLPIRGIRSVTMTS